MQVKDDDDIYKGLRLTQVNVVNNVLLLPTLGRRITLQVKDDGDLYKGQRSTEVKCGKLCSMAAIFGHKNSWNYG